MSTYVSNRNAGVTDEQGHYRFQTKIWNGNVLSGLAVTQNSPLARNVLVPVGDLKIDYGQYAFTGWNDAAVTVALATADTTNPRIDRIIAYINLAVALGTTNNPGVLKFVAVAGTPAGTPTKASDGTVNTAVGASNPWCEIATVRVEANATTIPNSKITDTRVLITVGDNTVPTSGLQDLAVTDDKINDVSSAKINIPCKFSVYRNAGFNVGGGLTVMQYDTKEYDTGTDIDVVTNKGRFTAPVDGFYSFSSCINFQLSTADIYYTALYKNGAVLKLGTQIANSITETISMLCNPPLVELVAGDYIEVYIFNGSGVNKTGTTGPSATYFGGELVSTA